MEIPFVLNGVAGRVLVDYRRNTDPASVGCPSDTADYPTCTATVDRPLRGYDSLMGGSSSYGPTTMRAGANASRWTRSPSSASCPTPTAGSASTRRSSTQMARRHNDANVACFGARCVELDDAYSLLETFLDEEFAGGRHGLRVDKLSQLGATARDVVDG